MDDVEDRRRDDAYTVDPAAVVERAEDRVELEDALVRLPFAHRAVPVLHDLEGWTVRSIAERLDGVLPGRDRGALEAHLATCPTCPPLFAAPVGTTARLGRPRASRTR